MRLEPVQHLNEAARSKAVSTADAGAFLQLNGAGEPALCQKLVRHPERLVETHWTAESLTTDFKENLVRDVIVRPAKHLRNNDRKTTRLAMNIDGLQALWNDAGRYLTLNSSPGALDESGDQLAGVLEAHTWLLGKADASTSVGVLSQETG